MKTYARLGTQVDKSAGPLDPSKWVDVQVVAEIISPMAYDADSAPGISPTWAKGDEIPIGRRFTPDLVEAMVDITSVAPQPQQGWTYDGKIFSAP